MSHLRAKLVKHEKCITVAEQCISTAEDYIQTATTKCLYMEKVLAVIQAKNEDLDARSRCNNLRIIGLPESTNTGRLEDYMESMLKELLGSEQLSTVMIMRRAHRSLAARRLHGNALSQIMAKPLNYSDWGTILCLAMEKQTTQYQSYTVAVAVYPDFTAAVQFIQVKIKLQEANVSFAMLCLAGHHI
ncbi:hypothetical protein NDU88_006000 [Pleurodeles waltl]|uniref:Uncharacterized protein n=1 Tax=Pleurodeles waltl TaxID=8319 RepID=A0AAV7UJQ9_PLEWA|nr:hypothetical protein NDU88_006000 [Pleurodeles waltl]